MSAATIVIHSLGWAIIHSIWQGVLIATVGYVLLLIFREQARVRYYVAYSSLMALLFSFLGSFFLEWQRMQTISVKVIEGSGAVSREYYIETIPGRSYWLDVPFLQRIEVWFPSMMLVYLAGICLLSIRFAIHTVHIYSYRKKNIIAPPDELTSIFERLCTQLQIRRRVKLYLSDNAVIPLTFGLLKPLVLLPVTTITQLSQSQLEAILLHELAHIRRNDYLLNIIQSVAETLLFFNPFAWLFSSIIKKEREHCCDDIVLTYTDRPLPYAQALASLASLRLQKNSLTLAATGKPNQLLNRIKRIMTMKKQTVSYNHLFISFMVIVGATALVFLMVPAIAQDKKTKKEQKKTAPKKEPVPSNHSTRISKTIIIDSEVDNKNSKHEEEVKRVTEEVVTKVVPQALEVSADALDVASEALREIDIAGIVADAMDNVNWEGVNVEINHAMKEIDWEKINEDMKRGLEEADRELKDPKKKEEIRKTIITAQKATREAAAEARAEMEKAREEIRKGRESMEDHRKEMEKTREEMSRASAEKRKAVAEARKAMDEQRKARMYAANNQRQESGKIEALVDALDKDGLIDRDKGYSILKSGKSLMINGKPQDASVYKKFEHMLSSENIIITGKKERKEVISSN